MGFQSFVLLEYSEKSHLKTSTYTDDRFRRLLPERDWMALPKCVRQRFSTKANDGESIIYRGVTTELKKNFAGRVLSQVARLIGAPLPLDKNAEKGAAIVSVTNDPCGHGQVWTRIYCRDRALPQSIISVKSFTGPTGLEEHVGGGISMSLRLAVCDGALLFLSEDYFVRIFRWRIKLPKALTPGRMVIGHHDMGQGSFAFTLTLTHAFFGVLISQTTIFHDVAEVEND